MLNKLIKELKDIDGLIFYSLFQLPENDTERQKIYRIVINLKKEIHFVVEDMKLKNKKDIKDIEQIILIKKTLPYSLKSI